MNPEDTWNETTLSPTMKGFLTVPPEVVSLSTMQATLEKADSLPIIISLICIFLLLATCLIFMTLCKPSALDQSRYGQHECMPYHQEDASEPQLRLWKRLGSLRSSINSFRRSRPISHHQRTCPGRPPASQNWDFMESTKM